MGFRKQREENNFPHRIRITHGSHCQGKLGSDGTRQACMTMGLSGSSDNEHGTRPSSTGQQNQPCTLLNDRLHMQYFVIVVARLTTIKVTQNREGHVCTANVTLALIF